MTTRGLIALSADPIHLGHLDLIRKARDKFDEIIVLVANNENKKSSYTFTLTERERMTRRAIEANGLVNVMVVSSDGLLPDIYNRYGCDVLIRGIRNNQDKEYEWERFQNYKAILPDMNIHFIDAAPEYNFVSSSTMKAWVSHNIDDVARYVPIFVKEALEKRILGQRKIGITGGMATGKTWVTKALQKNLELMYNTLIISMDDLIRDVYNEDSRGAENLRQTINNLVVEASGPNILLLEKHGIDRKLLGSFLFSPQCSPVLRRSIETLTIPHVTRKYRERTLHHAGLVLFEWAQLAEMSMGHWANYNVIVVSTNDRESMVAARGIDPDTFKDRIQSQWTTGTKLKALRVKAKEDHHHDRNIIRYDNCYDNHNDRDERRYYSQSARELADTIRKWAANYGTI